MKPTAGLKAEPDSPGTIALGRSFRGNGVFVTGTDTGIGKTYVASRLVERLTDRGIAVAPRKPVESGCLANSGGRLEPADGRTLYEASGRRGTLDTISPVRLRHALSPERAAVLENVALTLQDLVHACRRQAGEFLVVEGAGGFYSPMARDALNADVCAALGLPVIAVAEDRVGCINQALLVAEAIRVRSLDLKAIVLTRIHSDQPLQMANAEDLRKRLSCPVVSMPFRATADSPPVRELAELLL